MYKNTLVMDAKNAFDAHEFEELADFLYEIYNEMHDFSSTDIGEVQSFCEYCIAHVDSILDELDNNYSIEAFLRILDNLHKVNRLPENSTEELLFTLANLVHDFGESADDYSSGYAIALTMYPNSDRAIHALLHSLVEHAYICESGFSKAIARNSNEIRNKLLASIDLLSAFHLGNANFSSDDNIAYLLRDCQSYKQRMPSFSLSDFDAAKVFISSSTPLVQKYFTFPDALVMSRVIEIVGE
jgi:hypothetical protein